MMGILVRKKKGTKPELGKFLTDRRTLGDAGDFFFFGGNKKLWGNKILRERERTIINIFLGYVRAVPR